MGLHRQVPDRLRQLHPKYRTPWIGILVFGAIACVTIIPGKADFLGNMYAFGAMLSFTIAHLSVIRLRHDAAGRRAPLPRARATCASRGRELPLFAVLGGLGTAIWPSSPSRRCTPTWPLAGVGWLALGIARLRRLPPPPGPRPRRAPSRSRCPSRSSTTRRSTSRCSSSFDERGYSTRRSGHGAPARRAAAPRASTCSCPITVPWTRADRAPSCPSRSCAPSRVIEQAKVAGRPARDRPLGEGPPRPGRAADRRRGARRCARGRSSCRCRARDRRRRCSRKRPETVLDERPCRVIIESVPAVARNEPRADERAGSGTAQRDRGALGGAWCCIGVALVVRTLAAGGGGAARSA